MSSPQVARRLAHKTYSLKLPLQLASRLEALCEMCLVRPQAELLVDLLGLVLAQLEPHWRRPRPVWRPTPSTRISARRFIC